MLVGLRCAGKSSVGRALAAALELPFVDLDEELRAQSGSGESAGELLSELGEAAFREVEAAALADCLSRGPLVLAAGGGAVELEESRALLQSGARVLWLDASEEELLDRRDKDDTFRPLLCGGDPAEELTILAARRRPHYESIASPPLDTSGRSVEELARELADALRNEGGQAD